MCYCVVVCGYDFLFRERLFVSLHCENDVDMVAPKIENSTKEERRAYVRDAWRSLHDCEACGKCRVLKGRDAECVYADYIEGKRGYMDITLEIRNRSY